MYIYIFIYKCERESFSVQEHEIEFLSGAV